MQGRPQKCVIPAYQLGRRGLVKAIAALKEDEKLREEMKANVRKCFEKNFGKEMGG